MYEFFCMWVDPSAAICLVYYKDIFRLLPKGCRILGDAIVNVVIFFRNQDQKGDMRDTAGDLQTVTESL